MDHGNTDRPWIICLHGLTRNAHDFDNLCTTLAPRYHALSLDVRGRGDSEWGAPDAYTFPTYIQDLAGLFEALGIKRASLVGTSMGGLIAMLYAAANPEHIERVLLNDIGPEIDPVGLERVYSTVDQAPGDFDRMADVIAYYREIYAEVDAIAQASDNELFEEVRWMVKTRPDGRLGWKMDPAIRRPPQPPANTDDLMPDLWTIYAQIAAPMLIVRGAISDILSAETATRMTQISDNAKLVKVANTGHAPTLSEPEAMEAIKEFFGL